MISLLLLSLYNNIVQNKYVTKTISIISNNVYGVHDCGKIVVDFNISEGTLIQHPLIQAVHIEPDVESVNSDTMKNLYLSLLLKGSIITNKCNDGSYMYGILKYNVLIVHKSSIDTIIHYMNHNLIHNDKNIYLYVYKYLKNKEDRYCILPSTYYSTNQHEYIDYYIVPSSTKFPYLEYYSIDEIEKIIK